MMMKTIEGTYSMEGIGHQNDINENLSINSFTIVGNIRIQYNRRSEDFESGVLVGLEGLCLCDGGPDQIEELRESNDWYFDVPLQDILEEEHKRYIVYFEHLQEFGIFFATNNIIEFISGVASCPSTLNNINHQTQDWRTLQYLDTNRNIVVGNDEYACFNLWAGDLNINPEPITVDMIPI